MRTIFKYVEYKDLSEFPDTKFDHVKYGPVVGLIDAKFGPEDSLADVGTDPLSDNRVAVWVLHNDREALHADDYPTRRYYLYFTGKDIPDDLQHVASVSIPTGGQVYKVHVFQDPLNYYDMPVEIHEGTHGDDPEVDIIASVPNPFGLNAGIRAFEPATPDA
jgi:hypothetical protein